MAEPARRLRRSLLLQLLAWSLGALALVWASFIVVGLETGVHEADELTDGHLASVASLLLRQHGEVFVPDAEAEPGRLAGESPGLKSHDYQQSMSIVVWDERGHVVSRLGEAPLPPFTAHEGFADLALGLPQTTWRTFSRWDDATHQRKVMVLLSVQERDDLAYDIAGQMAAPGLWLLPVVSLALGFAIWRGLKPLHELSRDVDALDVNHPAPLTTEHPLEEFKAMVVAINALVARQHEVLTREREFANELAHELRTPLASIALNARALRDTAGEDERRASVTRVEADALRAGQVLSHVLALARASRTGLAEPARPLDLVPIARRVVAEYAQPSIASGHELAFEGADSLNLDGHPVLLEMALRNLIDNALDHTPPGTLVEVQIDAVARSLQVCDDGARQQPAEGASRRGLGLGLGHQVVEKIAAIHGARFESAEPPPRFTCCYRLVFTQAAHPRAGAV